MMLEFRWELSSLLLLIGSASASGACLATGHTLYASGFAAAVGLLVYVASPRGHESESLEAARTAGSSDALIGRHSQFTATNASA